MLEALLLLMLLFGAVVLVPLLAFKLLFQLLLGLLLLPFRIIGLAFRVVFGVFGVLAGLLGAGLGLVGAAFGLLLVLVLIPLFPLVFLAGIVWLLVKACQPAGAQRATA